MTSRRTIPLDDLDHKLLESLQQDAGRTLYELGDAVGLSPSAVQRRIIRYRTAGVIARQIAVLDPELVTGTVLAYDPHRLQRREGRAQRPHQARRMTVNT